MRNFRELSQLLTLEERFEYLQLNQAVGDATFGSERHFNQEFYRSQEWRDARSEVRARDLGQDMGLDGWPIRGHPTVHHMNPITMEDIANGSDNLFNPDGLITVAFRTHNAIHFGDKRLLPRPFVERSPGDTIEWEPLDGQVFRP